MKKMFMAVIALMMTISASAQFYIYCSDGNVIKVDSISMVAPRERPTTGNGVFSVSATTQVYFTMGNLQYNPRYAKWRIAESQLDYIGNENSNITSVYDGWLDLFGWSTNATYFGVSTSTSYYNDYLGNFVDWGENEIGSDSSNVFRTLRIDEWRYILDDRSNAEELRGIACVDGVNGLILLPDDWSCPNDVVFKAGVNTRESIEAYGQYQKFNIDQWSKMEAAGAVFLPAGGFRHGTEVEEVQLDGRYWSATDGFYNYTASNITFFSNRVGCGDGGAVRSYAGCVRLVKDL